jgi:hypothetical protein
VTGKTAAMLERLLATTEKNGSDDGKGGEWRMANGE